MKLPSLLYGALSLMALPVYSQQTVEIDWSTKKLTSQPAQIQSNTNIQIDVNNVNDVLYTYSITPQSIPSQIDDFAQIANAFKIAGQAAAGKGLAATCNVNEFLTAVKALLD